MTNVHGCTLFLPLAKKGDPMGFSRPATRAFMGTISLLAVFIPASNYPVQANDIERLGCMVRYVELNRGSTRLSVCYSAEVAEDRREYAMDIASQALPLIERHYGTPYAYPNMLIELGHDHSNGGGGIVQSGGGGSLSTIDWLMVHEMIHSFWDSETSMRWLAEGTANHGAARIRAMILEEDIDEALRSRRDRVQARIDAEGYDALLVNTDDDYAAAAHLGDVFMIDLYFLMGRDQFDQAYRDLYQRKAAEGSVDERDVARAFIRHCPEAQKCDMWEMFVDRMDNSFYFLFNLFLCQYAALSIFAVLLALLLASILIILRRSTG